MKTAYALYEKMLDEIEAKGLKKSERVLSGPQGTVIAPVGHKPVINLCANNYLGLSAAPRVIQAARDSLETWGFG